MKDLISFLWCHHGVPGLVSFDVYQSATARPLRSPKVATEAEVTDNAIKCIHIHQALLSLTSSFHSLSPPSSQSHFFLFYFIFLLYLFPSPFFSITLPTPSCGETDKKLICHPIKCCHWNIASKKPSFSPCTNWPSISMCICWDLCERVCLFGFTLDCQVQMVCVHHTRKVQNKWMRLHLLLPVRHIPLLLSFPNTVKL